MASLVRSIGSLARVSRPIATQSLPLASRMVAAPSRALGSRALSTQDYHEVADQCLEDIVESFETLGETLPQVDVDLGHGVLTLELPPAGTYVINKQPPNSQIWLSSPISGPKRYDYVDNKWVYARDNSTLGELLKTETKQTLDADLDLDLD